MRTLMIMGLCFVVAGVVCSPAYGEEESEEELLRAGRDPVAEDSEGQLARAAQNPIAELISVPFQNNMNFNVGPDDSIQNILNIQPVVPFSITKDWNLITRTIMPLVWQPEFIPGQGRTFGLGDIVFTGFFSPDKPSKYIWGVGPALLFPSATDDMLGTGKWGAGPSAVVVGMDGPWVYGLLISNIWSFAGSDSRRDVNLMTIQYFVNYNLSNGWYLVSAPLITANWEADGGEKWTLPFGAGAGKIIKIRKLPLNCTVQGYYNVEKPTQAGNWQLRAVVTFLFPKGM